MTNHIYPETGQEFIKQHRAQLIAQAKEARVAAGLEPAAQPRGRRSIRSLAFAVVLVVLATLTFASIVLASAGAGGGGGGGGTYLLM